MKDQRIRGFNKDLCVPEVENGGEGLIVLPSHLHRSQVVPSRLNSTLVRNVCTIDIMAFDQYIIPLAIHKLEHLEHF